MNIKNAVYKTVAIDWDSITPPLKAGTPIDSGGHVKNGTGAIGIVPQTVTERPLISTLRLLVGGDVTLSEVEASCGLTLTDDALAAMSGIRFFSAAGTPIPDYLEKKDAYELPAASSNAIGGVKQAAAVAKVPTGESADAAANATAINDLLDKLVAAGIMAEPEN